MRAGNIGNRRHHRGFRAGARLLACAALVTLAVQPGHAQLRQAEVFVSGLSAPVAFVQDPTDRNVFFVVEQAGVIRTIRNRVMEATPFLDIRDRVLSGGEMGLLGLVFALDYASSGRFFVNYTRRPDMGTVIGRYRRSANPLVADRAEFRLRWSPSGAEFIPQPFANHNGGCIVFGPDGYLYIGMGDGGSGNDPNNFAQRGDTLLGKFLRIDVNVPDGHSTGYVVPPTNPYLDGDPTTALPEVWSFGLRNPWRFSFDDPARGGTGALIIGDVGQGAREEIDYEPAGRGGRNYGWRNFEGTRVNVTTLPLAYQPHTPPIHEYDRNSGASVTGGYVYRGISLGAQYRGRYFFADFISARVWSIALTISGSGEATASDLQEHTAAFSGGSSLGGISSFGVDADGELYLVGYELGRIYKLVGTPTAPTGLRIIR